MQEWNEALLANDDYWDQNAFNDLMNRGAKFDEQRSDRLFMYAHIPCCMFPSSIHASTAGIQSVHESNTHVVSDQELIYCAWDDLCSQTLLAKLTTPLCTCQVCDVPVTTVHCTADGTADCLIL